MRAVFHLPTDHRDLVPLFEIVLCIPAPKHDGRAMDFNLPSSDLPSAFTTSRYGKRADSSTQSS